MPYLDARAPTVNPPTAAEPPTLAHDLAAGPLIRLSRASRRYPSPADPGKSLHVNTLRRWIRDGLFEVKLRAVTFGDRVYTTEAELVAFDRAVAAARKRLRVQPERLK